MEACDLMMTESAQRAHLSAQEYEVIAGMMSRRVMEIGWVQSSWPDRRPLLAVQARPNSLGAGGEVLKSRSARTCICLASSGEGSFSG